MNRPRRTAPVLYNEFDPYPAAWLRNLVRGRHIAPGVVDERSIEALTPADVAGRTQFHAFAGIGVWSYALRLAGWPDDRPVWTASCPCQPFSAAGDQRGFDDPRHLWPAFFRLVDEQRPVALFGEQVEGAAGRAWLDLVHADLEGAGYTVGAVVLPAASVGAPHIRHRIFWCGLRLADADEGSRQRHGGERRRHAEPPDGRLVRGDGLADADEAGRGGGGERHGGTERGAGGEAPLGHDAHRRGAVRGGLADTDDAGLEGRHLGRLGADERPAGPGGVADAGLAVPGREGRGEVRALEGGGGGGGGASRVGERPLHGGAFDRHSPWRPVEWLPCRDGKLRPTQPGLRPLVDRFAPGVAGVRTGSLRGYGNAIVGQVAAAFVRACMDAIDENPTTR